MDRQRRVKSVICWPDSSVTILGPWQGLVTDLKITNRDSEIPVMQMAYFRFNFGTRVEERSESFKNVAIFNGMERVISDSNKHNL
jgi:hypothetical protein